jgi:transcriptional regulator with XRE-family HTH domain
MQAKMLDETQAKENIAKNVRRLMDARAMTQNELAYSASVSQGFVSKILGGAILPNALLLHKLAEALGVSSDALIDFPKRRAS